MRGRKAKAPPSPCCEQTHGSSAVPGTSLLQDESPGSPPKAPPHPLAVQDAQHSPGPVTALAASQPAALQAHHEVSTRQHFPTEKTRQGKKNRRQKPQEKPHSAFPRALTQLSRQPCGMEKAVPAPHIPSKKLRGTKPPVAEVPCACPRPLSQQAPRSWDRQAGIYGWGGVQLSFIQTIN